MSWQATAVLLAVGPVLGVIAWLGAWRLARDTRERIAAANVRRRREELDLQVAAWLDEDVEKRRNAATDDLRRSA